METSEKYKVTQYPVGMGLQDNLCWFPFKKVVELCTLTNVGLLQVSSMPTLSVLLAQKFVVSFLHLDI